MYFVVHNLLDLHKHNVENFKILIPKSLCYYLAKKVVPTLRFNQPPNDAPAGHGRTQSIATVPTSIDSSSLKSFQQCNEWGLQIFFSCVQLFQFLLSGENTTCAQVTVCSNLNPGKESERKKKRTHSQTHEIRRLSYDMCALDFPQI